MILRQSAPFLSLREEVRNLISACCRGGEAVGPPNHAVHLPETPSIGELCGIDTGCGTFRTTDHRHMKIEEGSMCRSSINTPNRGRQAGNIADPRASRAAILGFVIHAAAYVCVTAILIGINLIFWSGYFWAVWPMMGWGIGVFLHGAQIARILPAALGSRMASSAPSLTSPSSPQETVRVSTADWDRTIRRLEHLEAIVTSDGWEPDHAWTGAKRP